MGDHQGDGYRADGETPVHEVRLDAFTIDATAVSVSDFARFVEDTGHITEAETFGYSAVFHAGLAANPADVVGRPAQTPWWLGVRGADWRHPEGRHSGVEERLDHPVTHVSWNDAVAYCDWAGRSLPTEGQWECAARGPIVGARYPWGDDLLVGHRWQANIWQGHFPTHNSAEDGYLTTAPVRAFEPHGCGLYQAVGNVWEWCADWFAQDTYARDAAAGVVADPTGPQSGHGRVIRGGSFLCHDSYCYRYRNAARSSNTPDSSAANTGFRTVGGT